LVETIASVGGSKIGGTAFRNYVGTVTTLKSRKFGVDAPDYQPTEATQWVDGSGVWQDAPTIDFGAVGYAVGTLAFRVKLGTNTPYTQQILEPGGSAMFAYTLEHYEPLVTTVATTTNASGEATVTYSMPGSSQWPEIRARVISTTARGWVLKTQPTNTSATVIVFDSSGAPVTGASVEIEVFDTGRGGQYVFVVV
jgi:hypothetical protein